MQPFRTFCKTKLLSCFLLHIVCAGICIINNGTLHAQCPDNIDFESGTFSGWTCWTGFVSAATGGNMITLAPSGGPLPGRHTMYSRGAGLDAYGGFPINCPNGSGHSIRLGNDMGGAEAEGVSYDFTIPANRNTYSLIYYYAVVFQDPQHLDYQQPRMEIEITNITDNKVIDCSSFTWIPYGTILPGFFESQNPGSTTPVWCKDWTPVSINLDNMAGKTIRLFFKTADCTFQRHFGYAYIDVNTECNTDFVGATFCPDDSLVNVSAPYGYQGYTWFDSTLTNILGNNQVLTLRPPPKSGSTVAVNLQPYAGFGCAQTLYAHLIDTLTVHANAGPDVFSCNHDSVQIGTPPKLGLVYSWSPSAGLSDPSTANPVAAPDITTRYVLTVTHDGGGCRNTDTVIVKSSVIDNSVLLLGKASYCIDMGDSSIFVVKPSDNIQWYKDNIPIPGANLPRFNATQSGNYYAVISNNLGCELSTDIETIFIDKPRPGVNYPLEYAVTNIPLTLQARNFGDSMTQWQPPSYLDNPLSITPVFKSAVDEEYNIKLVTKTGCITIDTQAVKVIKAVQVYVPTAFSPNSDGLNDVLKPLLLGVKNVHFFRIFNRWGQLLYETSTVRQGWDGKVGGMPQPTGVVVWVFEGIGVDGKLYTRKGTTALVR